MIVYMEVVMRFLRKLSDGIYKISENVACLLIFLTSTLLLTQVIMRFFFSKGISWGEEFARYSVIWAVMLIANVLIRDDELITVDFFDNLWPKGFLKWRDAIYQVVFLILIVVLMKEGWLQALEGRKTTLVSINIKWFYPYLAIPVGSALMLYQYSLKFLTNLLKRC